jgi:hypothetical protein
MRHSLAAIPAAFLSGLAVAALADDAHTIIQNGRAFHPVEVTINHGETLDFSNPASITIPPSNRRARRFISRFRTRGHFRSAATSTRKCC